jgi:transketolase
MAAALAQQGLDPLCYSIAPFCVFRPAEQIRVDVCLHNLNVKIVGNGGGYGYGIMGPTHHALEDLAVLSSFPNMKCFIPYCNEDLESVADQMMLFRGPSYLRLGLGSPPSGFYQSKTYLPIEQISEGKDYTVVSMGSVALNAINAIHQHSISVDLFVVREIPFYEIPSQLVASLEKTQKLMIIEEHVKRGGLGEHLSLELLALGLKFKRFKHFYALGYPNRRYGSQNYHQKLCKLDSESIAQELVS